MIRRHTKEEYAAYNTDDLLADEYFQEWALGRNPAADTFWQEFLNTWPDKEATVREAIALLNTLKFQTFKPEEALRRQMWIAIDQATPATNNRKVVNMFRKWWAAAACIALLILAAVWWNNNNGQQTILATANAETKRIVLPDSSIVHLNANSSLHYAADYLEKDRELWLDGEAYFEVQPRLLNNHKQPFIVHTSALNVTVTGTAFNIYRRGDNTRVFLNHGGVTVDFNDKQPSQKLIPGDLLSLHQQTASLEHAVDTAVYTAWQQRIFLFKDVPLANAATAIGDFYGYKVVFLQQKLSGIIVNAKLSATDLNSLTATLAEALQISIRQKGDTLVFGNKTTR